MGNMDSLEFYFSELEDGVIFTIHVLCSAGKHSSLQLLLAPNVYTESNPKLIQ